MRKCSFRILFVFVVCSFMDLACVCDECPWAGDEPLESAWGLTQELYGYISEIKPRDADKLFARVRDELKAACAQNPHPSPRLSFPVSLMQR